MTTETTVEHEPTVARPTVGRRGVLVRVGGLGPRGGVNIRDGFRPVSVGFVRQGSGNGAGHGEVVQRG